MAGSVKLFRFFQKFHQIGGIYAPQSNHKPFVNHTKSIKSVFLFAYAQYIFTLALFMALEAVSIFEYGFSFYILITIINTAIVYLMFISQTESTFKFIENCERFIEKSSYFVVDIIHCYIVITRIFLLPRVGRNLFNERLQRIDGKN